MKRRNKTIFKVTNDKRNKNEAFDYNDLKVTISAGTTASEMAYSLIALLTVVYEHEKSNGNDFTIDSFLNYLGMLMKDTEIGVPKDELND
jgi:hypothetical protein